MTGTERVVEERGEWWLPPDAPAGRLPTVVLVHGGYWGPGYDRHLEDAVAADLAGRGYLCWNIEYRAADAPWPSTLQDVAAAYDALATGRFADRVDPARLSVVGHSAGGHLALWLAAAGGVSGVVGLGAVCDLEDAAAEQLGRRAVQELLGGEPSEVPDAYEAADPSRRLPLGAPQVLVHGVVDDNVPIEHARRYATHAAGECRLVELRGVGHFEVIDPRSSAWPHVCDAVASLLA